MHQFGCVLFIDVFIRHGRLFAGISNPHGRLTLVVLLHSTPVLVRTHWLHFLACKRMAPLIWSAAIARQRAGEDDIALQLLRGHIICAETLRLCGADAFPRMAYVSSAVHESLGTAWRAYGTLLAEAATGGGQGKPASRFDPFPRTPAWQRNWDRDVWPTDATEAWALAEECEAEMSLIRDTCGWK